MKIIVSKVQSGRIKHRDWVLNKLLHRICKAFLIALPLLWMMAVDTILAEEKNGNSIESSANQNRKNQRMDSEFFKISMDANLVTADVTVVGKPLSQLSVEDFIVYDNGAAQEITHFSYNQLPIAVAFLIDRSGSVIDLFPRLQISSFLALRNLKPEDQVALFSFSDICTQQVKLTTDRLSIAEKISKIRVNTIRGHNTNIYGALQKTARYLLENAPDRRRAIILVSDEGHNSPDSDAKGALNELLKASVTLYIIHPEPSNLILPMRASVLFAYKEKFYRIPTGVAGKWLINAPSVLVANKEKVQPVSAGVAGKWLINGGGNKVKLEFKAAGNKVRGTIDHSGVPKPINIKDGKIVGDKISFYVERGYFGRKTKRFWIGTLSGDQIKFLVDSRPDTRFMIGAYNKDLKEIVEMTGGELLIVDAGTSLQKALSQANKNIRYRYTIGFSPSDPGEDGSYHKLLVKLASQDRCLECKLRTRKGYYAGISAPILSTKENQPTLKVSPEKTDELLTQRAILTAATSQLDLQDVPFTVKTVKQPKQNGQLQLMVQLNMDPAGIGFNKMEGRYICNLQIAVFYAEGSGRVIDYEWKKFNGRFSTEEYDRIIKKSVLHTTFFTIEDQEPVLKVVVYDEVKNSIGSKLVTLAGERPKSRGVRKIPARKIPLIRNKIN